MLDKKEIIKNLTILPSFDEAERDLEGGIRLHIIQRLYKLFQPLPIHIDIWNMVISLMYQGYIARNPLDKNYKRFIHDTGKQIINRTYDLNNRTDFRTTASSGVIIGFSGMGKTTTINRILGCIPQVIAHNSYQNHHFNHIQLTHLTLQTPHNSSLKALSLQFFMKVDEILGTNNYKKYVSRNLSVDAMLPLMGMVAHNIGLGLLVIDEIQHLQNRGVNQMMNYFVTLMNSFGVPVVFIGTPASYSLFQNEFRIARRVTGNGEILWNNMDNRDTFRFFIQSIWKYQWNRNFTSLNEEIIQLFYEETQGISDLVIKLFVNAQRLSISSEREELTLDVIKKTVKENFKLMKPMLDALRSGNPYRINQYEDLRKNEVFKVKEQSGLDIESKLIRKGEESKVSPQDALEVQRFQRAVNKKKFNLAVDDIRRSFFEGKSKGVPIYQILKDEGFIDDMNMWEGTGI
ncbi:ATP-binding protein [Paenibacillus glycinis]|uniref:AAA family ATPase n=1 Tax=Paenibacillus glycinis TaxID=2697035 RepID=A0ABW9XTG7_9BACL|nr:ATP-binding protein [Paenibacillus glycinis]NBD25634.1 AAA family ATPase [Paenibacillus glycinis]